MKQNKRKICAGAAAVLLLTCVCGADAAAADAPKNKPHQTTDTLFSVGSVSKIYVTAAAMQLADQGKLDIDAPVTDYIPEFRMADSRYKDITVRMLMNHRSGLMGSYYSNDILLDDRSAVPHDSFLQHLSTERLKAAPGAYGAYCNDGFELLEQVVEHVSGENFTDYIENHICKPLNLEQTGTPWNAFQTDEQTRVFQNRQETAPDYCMTIGEGGVLATAKELCTFGSAFFTGNSVLLSEKAKDEMRTRQDNDPYEDGFGLGWDSVSDSDYAAAGVQIICKGGDLDYQHAGLVVAPDEQISVAVVSSGGSSSADEQLAKALMDIALEEKGIVISHVQPEKLRTLDTVPDAYLQYEGLYAADRDLFQLSFPEKRYLEMTCLTNPDADPMRYLYTEQDSFVKVYGNAAKGEAVQPADSQDILGFAERDGTVYLTAASVSGDALRGYHRAPAEYQAQKIGENPVSEAAQAAWDARSGKKWYLCGDCASSVMYAGEPSVKFRTDVSGYAGNLKIKDSTHAESMLQIPSTVSRDQSDLEIVTENGREYLIMSALGTRYLAEDAIGELPKDLTAVELTTGEAVWYNNGSDASRSVRLDIPANAAVYVYDKRDRMIYSSCMKHYGENIPLPANGKVVFIGETGSTVGLQQN
ncbi:MAG: beta-lactamase family protein [Oscillospiraceae bacterium]|nr:beta-lactamase family protein [Oscillospiraceae bacterium]